MAKLRSQIVAAHEHALYCACELCRLRSLCVSDVIDVGCVIPRPTRRILEPTTNDGAGNLLSRRDGIGTVNYATGEAQIDVVHYNSTGRIR
jgi:hypothetical protein